MQYLQNNQNQTMSTVTKTVAGQAIDSFSPKAGLAYHIAATATANNKADFFLGALGIIGSATKMFN